MSETSRTKRPRGVQTMCENKADASRRRMMVESGGDVTRLRGEWRGSAYHEDGRSRLRLKLQRHTLA